MREAYLRAKALFLWAVRPKPKAWGTCRRSGRISESSLRNLGDVTSRIRVKFNFVGRDLMRRGNVKRGDFRRTLSA